MCLDDKITAELHFVRVLILLRTEDAAFMQYSSVYLNLIIASHRPKNVTVSVTKGKNTLIFVEVVLFISCWVTLPY